MGFMTRPFCIAPGWSAHLDRRAAAEPRDDLNVTRPTKPDLYADPGIRAAIQSREAAIQAGIEAEKQARAKVQHEAGAEQRCREINARIFQQVASIGGIRHGR
jgi:hypothetical protein